MSARIYAAFLKVSASEHGLKSKVKTKANSLKGDILSTLSGAQPDCGLRRLLLSQQPQLQLPAQAALCLYKVGVDLQTSASWTQAQS